MQHVGVAAPGQRNRPRPGGPPLPGGDERDQRNRPAGRGRPGHAERTEHGADHEQDKRELGGDPEAVLAAAPTRRPRHDLDHRTEPVPAGASGAHPQRVRRDDDFLVIGADVQHDAPSPPLSRLFCRAGSGGPFAAVS
jgi:hypothetical protein